MNLSWIHRGMTKITTKSKAMLTNHIITLCREGNGDKGIPNQIKS